LSITELEFRCAARFGKQCLTLVVDEKTPWPRVFDDAAASPEKGERFGKLRQTLLTEKRASKFSLPNELTTLVQAAITKQLDQTRAPASAPATVAALSWDSCYPVTHWPPAVRRRTKPNLSPAPRCRRKTRSARLLSTGR